MKLLLDHERSRRRQNGVIMFLLACNMLLLCLVLFTVVRPPDDVDSRMRQIERDISALEARVYKARKAKADKLDETQEPANE